MRQPYCITHRHHNNQGRRTMTSDTITIELFMVYEGRFFIRTSEEVAGSRTHGYVFRGDHGLWTVHASDKVAASLHHSKHVSPEAALLAIQEAAR